MKRNATIFAVIICALLLTCLSHAADLGLTPKQFKNQFNNFLTEKSFGNEFKINEIKVDSGPVQDTFTLHFNNIAMVGAVTKNTGNMNGITLIVTGDESTMTNAIILYGGFMQIFHPSITKSDRGQIMKSLLTGLMEKGKNSKISDNIKYSSTFSPMTGLWLSMESAT